MSKLILICLAFVSTILAHPDYSETFEEFKSKYNKNYDSEMEEAYREQRWYLTKKMITGHNEEYDNGVHTYRLGENHLADMTTEEIMHLMNGFEFNSTGIHDGDREVSEQELRDLPATVDWRDKGYVTHVKDQKHCGSCWAFSATGSMEGQNFKKTGKLVSLSEQNLVDCSEAEGNHGCFGGIMDKAFEYVIKNNGVDTESSYPYEAVNGKECKYNKTNIGATISSYHDIPQNSEADLQKAVATIGPISVAIDASQPTFHFYKEGIYHDKKCSSTHLDHGVLVVGYGAEENGKSYWLVKNSWNTSWGMKGYIKMAKDKHNACGIATAASYPIV